MTKGKSLSQILCQMQGSPDLGDLRRLIARLQWRLKVRKGIFWLIAALLYGLFIAGLATEAFATKAHDIKDLIIALIILSVLLPLALAFPAMALYFTMTSSCEEELAQSTHALTSIAGLSARVDALVSQASEFVLFLRGFEREQLGNSAKSWPIFPDRRLYEFRFSEYTPNFDEALESYNSRAAEFDHSWVRQLRLLTAVRKYGSVLLLENFNLGSVKREELRGAGIDMAPATSATWWGTFLVLASKARITIVLLGQRSPSVFDELSHLSERGLPYLIVTIQDLVKVLQRYSPSLVENAVGVIGLSDWSRLDSEADEEAIMAIVRPFLRSQTSQVKPARQRAPRREAQATPKELSPDLIDWSNREEVVAQLAMQYDAISRQILRERPYESDSLANASLLNCIVGLIICVACVFIQSLGLLLGGFGMIAFGLIGYLGPKIVNYVSRRKQDRKREWLRGLLQGRDYLDLMNEWGISVAELQWVACARLADAEPRWTH